jgi:hypothetical protein
VYAGQEGIASVVRLLLARGADPNGRARDGQAPLRLARQSDRPEKAEVIRLLVQAGAKP